MHMHLFCLSFLSTHSCIISCVFYNFFSGPDTNIIATGGASSNPAILQVRCHLSFSHKCRFSNEKLRWKNRQIQESTKASAMCLCVCFCMHVCMHVCIHVPVNLIFRERERNLVLNDFNYADKCPVNLVGEVDSRVVRAQVSELRAHWFNPRLAQQTPPS